MIHRPAAGPTAAQQCAARTQAVKALRLQEVQQHEELGQVVLEGGASQQRAVTQAEALQRLEQPRLHGQGGVCVCVRA